MNKVAALKVRNFVKKKLRHRCFPVNIAEFLKAPFFTEHLWWPFLQCTGYCFVQSWPKQTKSKLCKLFSFKIIAARSGPILHKSFFCAMLSQTYLDNIQYTIFLCGSSRPEVFCKKGVLKNFTKFTEKHLCQSLFLNKDAALRPVTLLKKRLWHRYFPVNFAKFLRAPFLTEPVWATASVCNVFPAW